MAANLKLYPEKVFDIQFDQLFPYRQMSFWTMSSFPVKVFLLLGGLCFDSHACVVGFTLFHPLFVALAAFSTSCARSLNEIMLFQTIKIMTSIVINLNGYNGRESI
ncbi:transmembrane protein, putative [Medicago truncatula]|uniref:Transmembrane protein, putative n=1 Tax=Medicago truncatula TaxID=3880 RepID=A0A072UZ46_MEDTR|nr:transmembrane protein, putative [Medicago truncatula]